MSKRINSGSLFIIAKDSATEADREYIKKELGLSINNETIPVGITETIDIKTEGDYNRIPKSHDELTNHGLWISPLPDSDTLILADVTLLSTRKGRGLGKLLMEHALKLIAQTSYQHIWTYTPNIEKIKEWHKQLGAMDTGYVIPNARPQFAYPDVNVMRY